MNQAIKKPRRSHKKCFPSRTRDDERPFWGLRHRMPQRAPMACPDRRRAHCHLPPRALPGAQPQQHGAQCAGQHHKQLSAPPTFLITRHQPCAPRGRVRRANASRFAHAFSRLRIALVPSTCSSFCSTHCSPACAACCTAPCKRRARELLQRRGGWISNHNGVQNSRAQSAVACDMRRRRCRARRAPVL